MHGLTIKETTTGARALQAVSLAVIGIVATASTTGNAEAQAALDAAYPLNTPVLITGGVDVAAGKAGDGGTLKPALEAIGDQSSPVVVVVRVAEGIDEAAMNANVIGATDGNAYTGLQALMNSEAVVGVRPQILGAPFLDTQPVVEELVSVAKKLRGFVYARAIGADVAEAVTYRGQFAHRELKLIWPGTSKDVAIAGDAVARALGLRAQIDQDIGWHQSLSNIPLVGVTGLSHDVFFDLTDPTTDAGVLDAAQITTIINQTGYRFWGNRTCADIEAQPEFSFETAVRTSHALQEICAQIVQPFLDKPMTLGLIKDLLETGNARFRQLAVEGKIVGAQMFFDADQNSAQELAQGRPKFRIQYTPVAPLENPTIDLAITDFYYSGFADQLL